MTTIFLDLDGVMADFEKYFEDHFGFKHDTVSDEEMWKHIDAHGNFFGSLPPMDQALEFFADLTYYFEPIILTACPKTNYVKAAMQKKAWVYEHLGEYHVLPVMGGKNKALFMKKEGDILIDDFDKNLKPWTKLGGVAVHHTSFYNTTEKLNEILALDFFATHRYV